MTKLVITPEKHEFHDNFLDVVANPFGSNHAKGLAEWVKNSVDAYNREIDSKGRALYADQDQFIFIRIRKSTTARSLVFECIDFVGMSSDDIQNAVKRWGDPTAASRGKKVDVLGGHGNGGKLYMRKMFKTSQFITYRNGMLNVFGFNTKGDYGFAQGLKNSPVKIADLIKEHELAPLIAALPERLRAVARGKGAGFTITRGEAPKNVGGSRNAPPKILERLCNHPQVKRVIKRKPIYAIIGVGKPFPLNTERIIPKEGFEEPIIHPIPKTLRLGPDSVEMANKSFPAGRLILRTSEKPFGGRSMAATRTALNCIEYLVGASVVGVDPINRLGNLRHQVEAEFLIGECECPILDDPNMRSVENDRVNLVENDRVLALRAWICDRVNELTEKMAEETKCRQNNKNLDESSKLNEFLNKWMRGTDLLAEIRATVFGGNEKGEAFGIHEYGETADKKKQEAKSKGDKPPGKGSGDKEQRGPTTPKVLLSNVDQDPHNLVEGATVDCDPRHPPVYQRPQDIEHGIFWINTQSPLAKLILGEDRQGAESTRWREYMFQRHVDITFKQNLYEKERKEAELSAEDVDNLLDNITTKISEFAATDITMQQFLFSDKL